MWHALHPVRSIPIRPHELAFEARALRRFFVKARANRGIGLLRKVHH
jgi:hypothetical protein